MTSWVHPAAVLELAYVTPPGRSGKPGTLASGAVDAPFLP